MWKKSLLIKWKSESSDFFLPIQINEKKVTPSNTWEKIRVKNFKQLRKQLDWTYALYDIEELGTNK